MSKKRTNKYSLNPKFIYEKEDDVLNIWLSNRKIDYAQQKGDVITHFTEDNELVYIEILDASQFLREQSKVLPKEVKEAVFA